MILTDRIKFVVSVGSCLGAAAISSLWTSSSVDSWYRTLEKPSFNPPSWVFGPVWTVLYISMGVALYLVWKQTPLDRNQQRGLAWFWMQLFFNALWSFLFFYLRSPGAALIDIILLWACIAATINFFRRTSVTAALLLVPYLAWVSFAACLNFAIWRLNS
ncbi:MAG TPA: TspO/MBR family protein [Abditibacteriaceae bacterium]|jgi:tryptophan-rich sensory protein